MKSTSFPHIEITLHVHLHCFGLGLGLINFEARFRIITRHCLVNASRFWSELNRDWIFAVVLMNIHECYLRIYDFLYIVIIAWICYNFEKRWLRWQIVKPTNKSFSYNTIKKCQQLKLNHSHIFLDKKPRKLRKSFNLWQ